MAYGKPMRPMNMNRPGRRRMKMKRPGAIGANGMSATGPTGMRGGMRNRRRPMMPVPGTGGPGPMPRRRTRRKSRFSRPNSTY
tara:strand:+ start:27 stop:275 length:249 start_codon:yes stop_codon:yes gene_type:complete